MSVLHHKRFRHSVLRIRNYPCLLFERQCSVIPSLKRCFGSYGTDRFRQRYGLIRATEREVSGLDMYFISMLNGL